MYSYSNFIFCSVSDFILAIAITSCHAFLNQSFVEVINECSGNIHVNLFMFEKTVRETLQNISVIFSVLKIYKHLRKMLKHA